MKLFFKFYVKLLLIGCALLALVSCSSGGDNGGSGSVSISAVPVSVDGCNNITNSASGNYSCIINLTYSSGGTSGLILSQQCQNGSPCPALPFDLLTSMLKCSLPPASGNSTQCTLYVGYQTESGPFSETVTFVLQNQKDKSIVARSNPITLATKGSN